MSRLALKVLRELAEEEKKKGAKIVTVYRLGEKTMLTRGKLPDLQVKGIEIPFLVCSWRREELRVYCCGENGEVLGGTNLSGRELEEFVARLGKCKVIFSV